MKNSSKSLGLESPTLVNSPSSQIQRSRYGEDIRAGSMSVMSRDDGLVKIVVRSGGIIPAESMFHAISLHARSEAATLMSQARRFPG